MTHDPASTSSSRQDGPTPSLSALDGAVLLVGIVLGVGIFRSPSVVAANAGDGTAFLLLWLVGGGISLVGALCYAELATAHPDAGGEYHFLSRAYGPSLGFLVAWSRMTVIQTGSIAILAFVIGDYAADLLALGEGAPPLVAGGTGSRSHEARMPEEMPDRLEAGTTNTPGLVALSAGLAWLLEQGVDTVQEREQRLHARMVEGLREIEGVTVYNPEDGPASTAVALFNIGRGDPEEAAFLYDRRFGIALRAGVHCAPWAHRWLGTLDREPQGALRASPGFFTTDQEMDRFLEATRELVELLPGGVVADDPDSAERLRRLPASDKLFADALEDIPAVLARVPAAGPRQGPRRGRRPSPPGPGPRRGLGLGRRAAGGHRRPRGPRPGAPGAGMASVDSRPRPRRRRRGPERPPPRRGEAAAASGPPARPRPPGGAGGGGRRPPRRRRTGGRRPRRPPAGPSPRRAPRAARRRRRASPASGTRPRPPPAPPAPGAGRPATGRRCPRRPTRWTGPGARPPAPGRPPSRPGSPGSPGSPPRGRRCRCARRG